ncbi:protoporphyrinogen oxidase HemJ [Elstera cyanobacteriorum]|uniref:Protoporphyrinogen IX oxidase n=1 Tax=Elstera cyanobacteriorum TaxID=2022747 RepID=A0A255XWL6_9PROT|nr:protoporphyrinogen oxidase HemJ [Elstera cyanobacteriorum]MCK6441723.1 protoporphyrinogen oxidase HemJ [Elstera cyanobacteriorum]OYQ20640.1 TIGR00701 family protein [Elstera cyanobacteriorum]GFZ99976.1 membrane protein [Elstera cyanobacteriorum]
MLDLLVKVYPWTKALHIISVIAWMAGMFYLPRLYVYHCGAAVGSVQSETFKVMEYKLLRFIINPAMIATFIFGGLLLATPGIVDWSQGWLHAKLTFVLLMGAFHGALSRWRRAFAEDRNTHSAKFYRQMNEVPTVLMILIVIMVVVRPF